MMYRFVNARINADEMPDFEKAAREINVSLGGLVRLAVRYFIEVCDKDPEFKEHMRKIGRGGGI